MEKDTANKYEICGSYVKVHMLNSDEIMLCDIEDWEKLKKHAWRTNKYGYAHARTTAGKRKNLRFHAEIIKCEKNMVRDHINRNKLDNRKTNIRITSTQVNILNRDTQVNNTSGHTGVFYDTNNGVWRAFIQLNGKRNYLGCFNNKNDAIRVRKEAEEDIHKPLLQL